MGRLSRKSPRDLRLWVGFSLGTERSPCSPGRFSESAAFHTQGFSDAFQRAFPSRDSAEAAWSAYTRDGTYPGYGRGPWVVYHGQRPGVFTKM